MCIERKATGKYVLACFLFATMTKGCDSGKYLEELVLRDVKVVGLFMNSNKQAG